MTLNVTAYAPQFILICPVIIKVQIREYFEYFNFSGFCWLVIKSNINRHVAIKTLGIQTFLDKPIETRSAWIISRKVINMWQKQKQNQVNTDSVFLAGDFLHYGSRKDAVGR